MSGNGCDGLRRPHIAQRITRLTPLDDVLARIDALRATPVPRAVPRYPRTRPHAGRGYRRAAGADSCGRARPPRRLGRAVRADHGCQRLCAGAACCGHAHRRGRAAAARCRCGRAARYGDDPQWDRRRRWLRSAPAMGVLPARRRRCARPRILLQAGRRLGRPQLALLRSGGHRRRAHPRAAPAARARPRRSATRSSMPRSNCIAGAIDAEAGIAVVGEPGRAAGTGVDRDRCRCGHRGRRHRQRAQRRHGPRARLRRRGGACTASGWSRERPRRSDWSAQRPVLAVPGRLDAALAAWHMLGRAHAGPAAGESRAAADADRRSSRTKCPRRWGSPSSFRCAATVGSPPP